MIGRRPLPGAAALDWARSLLLDAASRDRSGALAAGLGNFDSWESLAGLAETPWLAPAHRPSALALRRARHRLRLLGSPPASFSAVAGQGSDEPVHLQGVCAPLPGAGRPQDELWRREVLDDDGGHWLVDHGQDFTLTGDDGQIALVLAEGGRLVNGTSLRAGDRVSVFGFPDQVPDTAGLNRSAHGRGGSTLALRSGSELPLLVCLIRRYDQHADAPRR